MPPPPPVTVAVAVVAAIKFSASKIGGDKRSLQWKLMKKRKEKAETKFERDVIGRVDTMFDSVYQRKIKRIDSTATDDNKYGKQFIRKKWKNKKRNMSSLRSKRVKNLFVSSGSKCNSVLIPIVSDRELRRSVKKTPTPNIKELKSSLVGLTGDIGSTSSSANVLVVESDECYRMKGAIVKLKCSSSNQFFLVVKKDGITRYNLIARKVMRYCSYNRFTRDIKWKEENNNWKLEFTNTDHSSEEVDLLVQAVKALKEFQSGSLSWIRLGCCGFNIRLINSEMKVLVKETEVGEDNLQECWRTKEQVNNMVKKEDGSQWYVDMEAGECGAEGKKQ
ncbi:hypothetical protein HYC85_014081 [Camellia sinensis]|uniref:Uncharacterized protein n=1 Tax=Camellia sinensis TaxID=4442 RepID=A0A7J7H8F4_CAMSI|nr:hypothetical protein HYC85_014081 [Camellia sinensis]